MSIACLHENLGKSIAWKELVTHHPLAHVCPITLHEEVGVTTQKQLFELPKEQVQSNLEQSSISISPFHLNDDVSPNF